MVHGVYKSFLQVYKCDRSTCFIFDIQIPDVCTFNRHVKTECNQSSPSKLILAEVDIHIPSIYLVNVVR